jgi:hypothetical protein
MDLAPDFDEFIGFLTAHGVEFVGGGAYALAFCPGVIPLATRLTTWATEIRKPRIGVRPARRSGFWVAMECHKISRPLSHAFG